jgi:hypothetical protein
MVLRSSLSGDRCRWLQTGVGVALILPAAALVLVLKGLPYSSVQMARVEAAEAVRPPSATEFSVGSLYWPVAALQQDPALRPFRDTMRASCGEARGLAAAACATRVLRERTPVGDPATEYVNVAFDPVRHLERHLAGEPGHCLTRSAIVAALLLATGTPARVVQMLPVTGKGHTLVEVWDDALGWTVVDPSNNGYLTSVNGPSAAADLLASPGGLEWRRFGSERATTEESDRQRRYFLGLLTGNVLYPEPWLYLRQGQRIASWPFRGQYARVGPLRFVMGPLQQALVVAIPALLLSGVALLLSGLRRRTARARSVAWTDAVPARARSVERLDALSRSE